MDTNQNEPVEAVSRTSQLQTADEKAIRFRIAVIGFACFIVFVFGLFWFITSPNLAPGLMLSFIAGLSMIFLPCTLPLAFVIVPMTMGKDPKKGFLMALSFGAGLTITLSLYGVFIAALGKTFGLKSDAEVYAVLFGGIAAFLFGLSEVGLVNFKLPSYSGKFPDFIQRQKDYLKTFLLGLLLGNVGVGCPNPAFYVLLGYIATTADLFNGWILGFVHGLGRVVPLVFLSILGVLGINALSGVAKHKDAVERAMGWALVIIGTYLLTFGIFGHDWFVASGMHGFWESFVSQIGGENFGEVVLKHEHKLVNVPNWIQYGNMFFLALLALTIFTAFSKKLVSSKTIKWLIAIYISLAFLIGYTTGWTFKVGMGKNIHVQFKGDVAAPDLSHMNNTGQHDGHTMPSVESLARLPLRSPANSVEFLPFTEKDGVKEFRLTASEFRWEYEQGKWMHVWGYNGQIPGPAIRVTEGDKVRIIVKNNLPDFTTAHWHSIDVPWKQDGVAGLTQEPIPPGGEFAYEFSALPAGTRFYHSHGKDHMTVAQQMDMGLSGAFIIEPKKQTLSYDRDYTLLLDEWEIMNGVNTAVGHVHGAGMTGVVPDFNTFTINGRTFPSTKPIDVKEGEDILIRLINTGTSVSHPMHLHGHSFTVVALDGHPVPLSARQERNTITVNPGETVDILVRASNSGTWLFHCHEAHHAAAGMITLFQYDNPAKDK